MVLLLVFRSPIAALIPLAFGAVTVVSSRGVLAIAANWLSVDAFALTVSTMLGLALGVDYTLLMVSRFREELADGGSPSSAAAATRRTAGRTIAFAGGALFVSMTVSALIVPGNFLVSLAGAVVVVAALSIALGLLVLPASLFLLGANIDRWRIGIGRGRSEGMLKPLDHVLSRPGFATALLSVSLTLLALPAVSLAIGPPSLDQLPSTNRARLDAELVNREAGPGWAVPYVVLASTADEPITSQANFAALEEWERSIRKVDTVQAVIGPGTIARRIESLSNVGQEFLAQGRPESQAGKLLALGSHLRRAGQGVGNLRSGITRATYGASLISDGSQNLGEGAQAIASGLAVAATGSSQALTATDRFASGASEVRRGQHSAALGAQALKYDLRDLTPRLRHRILVPSRQLSRELDDLTVALPDLQKRAGEVDRQLAVALTELQQVPVTAGDPHYAAALEAVRAAQVATAGAGDPVEAGLMGGLQGFHSGLSRAAGRADRVTGGTVAGLGEVQEVAPLARRLLRGLIRLERSGQSLDSGARQLAKSTEPLAAGLPQLSRGAAELADGSEELVGGSSSLASNLSSAYVTSRPLESGLQAAATQSKNESATLRRNSRRLRELSPDLFRSGYFNLSALDGMGEPSRSQAEQAVAINGGGEAARILVVPKHEDANGLGSALRRNAVELGRRIDGTVLVGGGRAELRDYASASSARLPVVIAAVSIVMLLTLVIALRAILAAAITVALNLLSVAVAFGVLALVSDLPSGSPIGDWSHIDAIGAIAIFAVAFGVSIDYSMFVLTRTREVYDQCGDHRQAVSVGVRRSSGIITGAALMMVAVFAAFATSDLAIISQLGVGLTVAILVDATAIRLALLPALLLLIGERCWWLPVPLARLMANLRLA